MTSTPKLTAVEQMYFDALNKHDGVVARSIFEDIHDDYPASNVVDVHMMNLRRKLEGAYLIETARGVGYKMTKI